MAATFKLKERIPNMNTKNLLIAGLIGGLVCTALSNIPVLNLVNCLLCVGFWGGAILAAWLYKRFTGSLTLGQGVLAGTVAGVCAGLLGFLLSFFGLAGASGLMATYSQFLPPDALTGAKANLVGPMAVLFNLVGVIVNVVFGVIGGLIGGAIFKSRPQTI
jgi:hypothetical protein